MVADELVVPDDGAPVFADVRARVLGRAIDVLVAVGPAADDRRRGVDAVHVAKRLAIVVELGRDDIPRLLRDDEDADPELRHDLRGFRRHGGGVGAAPERLERPRAELAAPLLHERAVELHPAALEPFEDHLRRLDEDRAALLLVDAEAFELDPAEPAADAEDQPPVREVIEHEHLLGDPDRVVPRQHDHHRAELDGARAAGEVRQVLQHVGTHRVVGEVVLDPPQRLEAEGLGQIREADLVPIDVAIGAALALSLEDDAHSDVHVRLSFARVALCRA
jgi:hypothetical protein